MVDKGVWGIENEKQSMMAVVVDWIRLFGVEVNVLVFV